MFAATNATADLSAVSTIWQRRGRRRRCWAGVSTVSASLQGVTIAERIGNRVRCRRWRLGQCSRAPRRRTFTTGISNRRSPAKAHHGREYDFAHAIRAPISTMNGSTNKHYATSPGPESLWPPSVKCGMAPVVSRYRRSVVHRTFSTARHSPLEYVAGFTPSWRSTGMLPKVITSVSNATPIPSNPDERQGPPRFDAPGYELSRTPKHAARRTSAAVSSSVMNIEVHGQPEGRAPSASISNFRLQHGDDASQGGGEEQSLFASLSDSAHQRRWKTATAKSRTSRRSGRRSVRGG